MIEFVFEEIKSFSLQEGMIDAWIEQTISSEGKISGDICFIFCSDDYLLRMNQQYLKHDYYTDVITFDYSGGAIVSGDIFISADRIVDNAEQFAVSFDYELRRVIIHGILHLCGYGDKSESEKAGMTSKEDKYLKLYGNV